MACGLWLQRPTSLPDPPKGITPILPGCQTAPPPASGDQSHEDLESLQVPGLTGRMGLQAKDLNISLPPRAQGRF